MLKYKFSAHRLTHTVQVFLFSALLILFTLTFSSCALITNLAENLSLTKSLPQPNDERISAPVFEIQDNETTPVTEAETEPPEDIIKKVSFMGVGDNIIYYGNVREAQLNANNNGSPRSYDFKSSYSDLTPYIEAADIAFINQETLMCGDGYEFSYYPRFNGPQDLGYDLCELGFDVVNIANNHMIDKGESGLKATIDFWHQMMKDYDVTMIGGYTDRDDYFTPRVIESNGIEIAFLSYTYFTNYLYLPETSPLVAPYLDESVIASQVSAAKEVADLVIVSVHWGDENTFTPNDTQKHYAKLFADCGVDVILGHHPHVIQPIEWIEGENGNKTLCVYSLGNIMAEQAYDYNMVGGIINFDIVQINDDSPTIQNVLFTPTVFDHSLSFYNNHIYIMENYTSEQASAHGIGYYGNYTSLETLRAYVTKTIDKQFLPEYLK